VRVTVLAALVVPTSRLAKVRVVGATVAGAKPVPVRVIAGGFEEALSVTISDAVRLPAAEGENETVIVQLLLAPNVSGLLGQVPPAVEKSAALAPELPMLVIVRGAVACTFLRVSVFVALVAPSYSFPKARLVGSSVTGTTPAPLRVTGAGLEEALSVTMSDAGLLPATVGVNVIVIVQLWPAPTVSGPIMQLPPKA
jgi:hypothetical protein